MSDRVKFRSKRLFATRDDSDGQISTVFSSGRIIQSAKASLEPRTIEIRGSGIANFYTSFVRGRSPTSKSLSTVAPTANGKREG